MEGKEDEMMVGMHFIDAKNEEELLSINDGPSFVSPARVCHDNLLHHSRIDSNLTAVALLQELKSPKVSS